MPAMFTAVPGKVAVITGATLPMTISIDGTVPTSTRAIITAFRTSMAGKYQFLHTLNRDIWVYTFGEAMGNITISGVCFASGCAPTSAGPNVSGIEEILEFYRLNKLSATGKSMILQIGSAPSGRFNGFLTSCQVGIDAPEHQLGSFALGFQTVPISNAARGISGKGSWIKKP